MVTQKFLLLHSVMGERDRIYVEVFIAPETGMKRTSAMHIIYI
jgi:hypothetical protein